MLLAQGKQEHDQRAAHAEHDLAQLALELAERQVAVAPRPLVDEPDGVLAGAPGGGTEVVEGRRGVVALAVLHEADRRYRGQRGCPCWCWLVL